MRTSMRHIPNTITCVRLVLLPFFLYFILAAEVQWALCLFAIMGVSDAVDGWLAKKYEWCSRLGSFLDPLADKLMLVSAFIVFLWLGWLPVWLVSFAIARDVLIGSGYLWLRHLDGGRPQAISPSLPSKFNTVFQVVLVLLILLAQSEVFLPLALIDLMIFTSGITTVLSGADYARTAFSQSRSLRARRSFSRTA